MVFLHATTHNYKIMDEIDDLKSASKEIHRTLFIGIKLRMVGKTSQMVTQSDHDRMREILWKYVDFGKNITLIHTYIVGVIIKTYFSDFLIEFWIYSFATKKLSRDTV